MKVEQIETPALLVDLDSMESNLLKMSKFFEERRCKVRPHFKNHKVPLLAWKQLNSGAIGITCATLREAEILLRHGVRDVLIANEVAGSTKPDHLAELSRNASVIVAIDSTVSIKDLARAQRNKKSRIEVVVDIDIGLGRCGVPPGQPALDLARSAVSEGLTVRGVMGYDGHFQAQQPSRERDELVRKGSEALVASAALLDAAEITSSIVSTGGTGTYAVSGDYPGITEIQAGSYLLMDTRYLNLGAKFRRSLTVLSTVISTRGLEHAVLDSGMKTISGERGLPTIKDLSGAEVIDLHAEHAIIAINPQLSPGVETGQKLELWVYYSDATVNLHTRMYGVRHGNVEEVFQIEH